MKTYEQCIKKQLLRPLSKGAAFAAIFLTMLFWGSSPAYALNKTVTNIDTFYTDLKDIIDAGGGVLSLELGSGEVALKNFSLILLNNDANVTIRSLDGPVTLTPEGSNRHLDIYESSPNPTFYTLELDFDDVILDGKTQGGGLSIYSQTCLLKNVVVRNCQSSLGGGVYISSAATGSAVTIIGGEITGNSATNYGGGIYSHSNETNIQGVTIDGNSANYDGGGIYGYSGDITIQGGTVVSGNSATNNGGGIYSYSGNITISGGTVVSGNTANNDGGGIYSRNGATGIQAGTIDRNFAINDGGGIYSNNGVITIQGGRVSGNSANNNGGGIWMPQASYNSANITNDTIFTNNLASEGYEVDVSDSSNFSGVTNASKPFTHILNNYDVNYTNPNPNSNVYSVAFMLNDGSGNDYDHVVATGSTAALGSDFPSDPTRSGYSFIEWNSEADGSGNPFEDTTPLPGYSIRVYAQWQKNPSSSSETQYTIGFNTGGGSKIADRSVTSGTTLPRPSDPKREGYIFTGWYTTQAFTELYNFSWAVNSSFTLYAGWEAEEIEPEEVEEEQLPPPEEEIPDKISYAPYISGYPDGTFGPENTITRAEAAAMFYQLAKDTGRTGTGQGVNFTDVQPGAWYYEAVTELAALKIISGYPGGAFQPDGEVTWAEFIVMALALGEIPPHSDTDSSHWAAAYISTAAEAGIVSLYPYGEIQPDEAISRAEAVAVLNKITGRDTMVVFSDGNNFTDVPQNHRAYEAVVRATSYGLREE